jgi:hypothetical protein
MWTFIRAVDADGIHGGRHLIAGNLRRLWRVPTQRRLGWLRS